MDHTRSPYMLCRSCQQPIKFIEMISGKKMPVDAELFVAKDDDPHMSLVLVQGKIQRGVKAGDVGYVSHFSTCNDPDRFRKS